VQYLELLKEKLKRDPNVLFALVFGSRAKGLNKPLSDVDVAVFFKQPLSGLDLLELIHELSGFVGKEVDLVVLNNASAFLRHQVMKKCIRLFVRDQLIYREFREKTMTDYDTYKFVSGMDRYDRQTFD